MRYKHEKKEAAWTPLLQHPISMEYFDKALTNLTKYVSYVKRSEDPNGFLKNPELFKHLGGLKMVVFRGDPDGRE